MVESGRMTRSTELCEMSRSCHSAIFSSAAWALARTTRARPQICSLPTGLRLCGIAELPRCSPPKGSSASRTSVRCRWRISSAICSSEAATIASVLTIMRVAVALDHLRGDGRGGEAQALADFLLRLQGRDARSCPRRRKFFRRPFAARLLRSEARCGGFRRTSWRLSGRR